MTSHDNRDNILSDQKLHDLLKAEDEMDHREKSKLGAPEELAMPVDEDAEGAAL